MTDVSILPNVTGAVDPLAVTPLSDVAGAEISGVDLATPLTPGLRDAIMAAFVRHHVLVFRDQALSKDQQYAYTLNFGEIEEHVGRLANGERFPVVHTVTNIDRATGKPTASPHIRGNYFWHTDKSYHAVPSLLTMLHAVELPPSGGDTLFANMHMAYDALPISERKALEGLRAVHSWEASRRNTGSVPATEQQKRERPPVSHPLIRTHPVTGRKSLYLGTHTSHVEGMPYDDGRALLDSLLRQATVEAHVYRHVWKPGDLVMWDNRCLLHRADQNYDMGAHPRVLHRTVVRGTVPV